VGNSRQLKFNRTNKILTYTNAENQYEYKVLVGIKELQTYNVTPEYIREDSYWVELYNPATKEPVFRSLVNADKSGYLFVNKPEGTAEEEPVIFNKDWTADLPEHITNAVTGVAPPPKTQNTTRRNTRFSMYNNYQGGALGLNRTNASRTNASRTNASRANATRKNAAAEAHRQEIAALQLAATTTLPRTFQESYKAMIRWTVDVPTWTEAAPASYRSVLLFIKPTPPGGVAASYLCVDNWANKSLRYIQPFAALESLYFNNDDGSMSQDNKANLQTLVSAFANIFQTSTASKNKAAPATFEDLNMPPINEAVKNLLCGKRTAQGDILLNPLSAQVLESAQTAVLASYTRHFDNAYQILGRLFTLGKTEVGEPMVKFSDEFTKNPGSARVVLETIIREARSVIASHYIEVETIYADAMKELVKSRA
jgi:hypothetical protein